MSNTENTLLLALGNEILGDDGIAIRILKDLRKQFDFPGISYKSSMNGGIEIVELLSDFRQVIIIDSIKTQDGVPGAVYHFTPEDFSETIHISSFHDVSFLTALKFATYIHLKLPEVIDIIAIEIVEDMEFTESFSPEIEKSYSKLRDKVEKLILSFIPPPFADSHGKKTRRKVKNTNLE